MALYLVDFENVHDSGLNGVTNLTAQDDISIFYSIKSEHMSFDTHVSILKSAARVKYIKLRRSAKNYLDFQLVTHLGYLIGSGHPGPYFIISKDTGYDSVVDYWKDHGITVHRQPAINYNLTQRKSTGQAPVHNTPPAIVTLKEGTVVSTPQIALLPGSEQPSGQQTESAALLSMDPQAAEATETAAPSEAIMESPITEHATALSSAAQTPSSVIPGTEDSKRSRSSRSRKNSRKKAASDDAANGSASQEKEAKADIISEQEPPKQPELPIDGPFTDPAEPVYAESPEFSEESGQIRITPHSLPESYRKKVRTALRGKNIPSANYSSIYKAIINSYDKLALNNLLVKTFGSSKGGEIYKLIKDIFMDYQSVLG